MPNKWRADRTESAHRMPLQHTELTWYDGKPYGRDGTVVGMQNNRLQHIVSEGHPYRLLGKRGAPTDIGGPFTNRKVEVSLGPGCEIWHMTGLPHWRTTYAHVFIVPHSTVGSIVNDISNKLDTKLDTETEVLFSLNGEYGVPALESVSTLNSWGTSVISSVKPTNPVADLAVSLGEFVSERKFFALPGTSGSLPGEYLNFMFGVSPTIDLVKDLRNAISNSEELLNQYSRDSGRIVRRRYEPEPEVTTTKTVVSGAKVSAIGSQVPSYLSSSGQLTTITKTTNTWAFSGAFTYYLPKSGWGRTMAELDFLYGVKPGLSLAWELLPYSWLLDYKLNIGAALSNIDAFALDGLVMPYAYVQRKRIVDVEYMWDGTLIGENNATKNHQLSANVVRTTMQRVAATPFGFGIDPGSLSLRQLSIIAALGLSRV